MKLDIKYTIFKISKGNCKGLYDVRIWYQGSIIQYSSGTAFELKSHAVEWAKWKLEEYKKTVI